MKTLWAVICLILLWHCQPSGARDLPGDEYWDVPCRVEGCASRWPTTAVTLNPQPGDQIIIWLSGGDGRYPHVGHLNHLYGRVSVALVQSPYAIQSWSQGRSVPQAYGRDGTARIRSIVQWAHSLGYRSVVLGGHSNGAARVVGYLARWGGDGITHAILAAANVHDQREIRIGRVAWAWPTMVIWHEGDTCTNTRPQLQEWMWRRIHRVNSAPTVRSQIPLAEGGRRDPRCSGPDVHHTFGDSHREFARRILEFIR